MKSATAERQFHAVIFQRKMEQREIENQIIELEKKFKHADKYCDISAWFDLQDQLGVMYNRLMKIWRIKNSREMTIIQNPVSSIQNPVTSNNKT